jgi:D-glycero-alpha-D-manno-heptose-7-phosphate kinase
MIISKTPLRMSWVGGGSDLPAYYRYAQGAVLSTSINKYVYVALNHKFDGKIRLNYSKTEEIEFVDQIEHPIFREVLRYLNITGGIEIASMADIPSKGSGLGSSSSFTVGLLNVLYSFQNKFILKTELAKKACFIEIEKCNQLIGKQDQYAAAFGGINLFKFNPDDTVDVEPLICKPDFIKNIELNTLVFYTGRTRSASELLTNQSRDLATSESKNLMKRMVELVFELKHEMENNNLDNFGSILHENWRLKSQLTKGISDSQIDNWYQIGLDNGATGGKLLGAGNGGFLMFFAPYELHKKIEKALYGLLKVDFKFDTMGSQTMVY